MADATHMQNMERGFIGRLSNTVWRILSVNGRGPLFNLTPLLAHVGLILRCQIDRVFKKHRYDDIAFLLAGAILTFLTKTIDQRSIQMRKYVFRERGSW